MQEEAAQTGEQRMSYTGQVQRHWSRAQGPLTLPQAAGTAALHSPAPPEGAQAMRVLWVSC